MRLIKSSYEIWQQPSGLEGIYRQIERAGRVCYRSEDKITEDSAKPFVDRMIKSGHGAILEHGTVYLQVPNSNDICLVLALNPYTKYKSMGDTCYATTNLRVLAEHDALWLMKYQCEPTEFHEKRICVKFICDRGILAEFTRHRTFSFSAESTRYCNYSKDKFNNELTFIKPCWLDIPAGQYVYWDGDWCDIDKMKIQLPEGEHKDIDAFLWTLNNAETHYTLLINSGWKPQEARAVLPNSLKTELVMTGFIDDWWGEYLVIDKSTGLIDQRIHGKFYTEPNNIDTKKYRIVEKGFFPLRCNKGAHPQAQELAVPLRETFINQKIW